MNRPSALINPLTYIQQRSLHVFRLWMAWCVVNLRMHLARLEVITIENYSTITHACPIFLHLTHGMPIHVLLDDGTHFAKTSTCRIQYCDIIISFYPLTPLTQTLAQPIGTVTAEKPTLRITGRKAHPSSVEKGDLKLDIEMAPFNFIASAGNLTFDVGLIYMDIALLEDITGMINFCTGEAKMFMNSPPEL